MVSGVGLIFSVNTVMQAFFTSFGNLLGCRAMAGTPDQCGHNEAEQELEKVQDFNLTLTTGGRRPSHGTPVMCGATGWCGDRPP